MKQNLRVSLGAVVLALATLAAMIFAWLNFVQRAEFETPDDGVVWLDTTQGIQAQQVAPNSPALRALQRDIAWGFFYGIVNFDAVVGTVNHYGSVDLFAGRFNAHYRKAGLDHSEETDRLAVSRLPRPPVRRGCRRRRSAARAGRRLRTRRQDSGQPTRIESRGSQRSASESQ